MLRRYVIERDLPAIGSADRVGEVGQGLHHPRAAESLAADAVDHVPVDRLLGLEREGKRERRRQRQPS